VCRPDAAGDARAAGGRVPGTTTVDALLGRMTLEQKVGQVMVIGFDATDYDAGVREMIEKYQVGGVIFRAQRRVAGPGRARDERDADQRARRQRRGLLIAVDQEGGRVAAHHHKGFTEFPGAMALGATARGKAGGGLCAARRRGDGPRCAPWASITISRPTRREQ